MTLTFLSTCWRQSIYCDIRLDKLLKSRPSYKRRWLFRVKAAIAKLESSAHASQPKMTAYFPRSCPNTHTIRRSQTTAIRHKQQQDDDIRRRSRLRHSTSTQQLLTQFLKERASNPRNLALIPTQSPPPHQ
jgi:hypothetical protein